MANPFIPYTEGKPGDWVVFSPQHGYKTDFWDREMVMCIQSNGGKSTYYEFLIEPLIGKYPQIGNYHAKDATCTNTKAGFRKAELHEIPTNIINNYSIY